MTSEWTPTIHPWDHWVDPKFPITGPVLFWPRVDTIVEHYTADDNLIDGDPGEHASDLPQYLRNIQSAYRRTRGYSIGYNWAVDWLGGLWKLRGNDILPAANRDHNGHTTTVLMLVDGPDTTTEFADRTVRWLNQISFNLAVKELKIKGHDQLRDPHHPTMCPGAGVLAKINSGQHHPSWKLAPVIAPVIAPPPVSPPAPAPAPATGDIDMASIIRPNDNDIAVFTTTGSFCEWIPTQDQVNALVWLNIATHGGQPGVLPAVPVPVSRGLFGALTLIGAPPTYPARYAGPKTSPADFKRWVP